MERISAQAGMRTIGLALAAIAVAALAIFFPMQSSAAEPTLTPEPSGPAQQGTVSAAAQSAGISYRIKASGQDWQDWTSDGSTAQLAQTSDSLQSIALATTGNMAGSVHYQVHIAGTGWTAVTSDGAEAENATKGGIDAVRIALTGKVSRYYDVNYRVSADGSTWQGWKRTGAISGYVDGTSAIRALQVKLVQKANAPTSQGKGILGVRYRVNSLGSGWSAWATKGERAGEVAKNERIVGFEMMLDKGVYEGGIRYRVRFKTGEWKSWRYDGTGIGPTNKIEAIQIELTGAIAEKYDVIYRTYVQGVGWQRRMRNGETAGTTGRNLSLGSIRVSLIAKSKRSGWVNEDGNWVYYKAGKRLAGTWLVTKESPFDEVLTGEHRYWIDANGALAVNRFVDPRRAADAKAKYAAYAGSSGYVLTGKAQTPKGLMLAAKNGKLCTKTGWLVTKAYDGSNQRYRLARKGAYSVVKTGIFKVAGKRYFGWDDGRGYLMRSTISWVKGHWYKANSKGALKNYDSKTTKHIDRYVKWAIRIARDDSHGYSQANRWGPDYDCSSLVCSALKAAGFPDSGATWTGNMRAKLKKIGFVWHKGTTGLRRGDIMLVHARWGQHTEIYIGNNRLVGAHIAETGKVTGKTGDQTGREISVRSYYNYPWQGYLRYKG